MSAPDHGFDIDPRAFQAPEDEGLAPEDARPQLDAAEARTADAGIASLARIEEELGEVEDALSRLDEGRYGTCQSCGAPLDDAWLADHPTERQCAQHRETVGGE